MSPQASSQISCPTSITNLCITPRHIIATTVPGTVVIIDITCEHHNLESDPHVKRIEAGELWALGWHGSLFVTGHTDGTAKLWNAENGLKLKEFPGHGDRIAAVLMPDESTVITGTGDGTHTIWVWDVASGSCLHKLDRHTKGIVRLETVGSRLISGSLDQTVRIWDLRTGVELHQLDNHTRYPYIFGFNDDKTLLAAACSTGDIKIWRIEDGTGIATCQGHTRVVTQFENRGGNLVSASADGAIRTWSWEDGSLHHAIDPAHPPISDLPNAVRGMAWTNPYMITGGCRDGLLKVWDKESNKLISEYAMGNMAIWNLVGGQGKVAVSSKVGNELHQITIWDESAIDTEGL